ncbi:hypothetical protein [Deinococcus budaensis]|uniref:DUF2269 domain-containing protein n=1 Tax=Deinococcus budaensis TaxID=1665626 RepID=A0A7W8LQ08_9DEIO|nr:hypothetical protein [Deinococcus budaensis]MBB5234333.1 hypothetical protein [Deinococcus budaensis]
MTMTPSLRRFTLTAHVAASVGWLGAVAAFLALAVVGLTSQDPQVARAAAIAMEPITRFVIVPLALAALVTGILQALGTPWGLFRHYWVLIKLILTVVATGILLLQMEGIHSVAGLATAATLSNAELRGAMQSMVLHAGGGALVLLVVTTLSVYKPRGKIDLPRRRPPRAIH